MPDTSRLSDIESLDASSEASSSVTSMTPDLAKLTPGRGQGRPRKEIVKPTMEDFPLDVRDAHCILVTVGDTRDTSPPPPPPSPAPGQIFFMQLLLQ